MADGRRKGDRPRHGRQRLPKVVQSGPPLVMLEKGRRQDHLSQGFPVTPVRTVRPTGRHCGVAGADSGKALPRTEDGVRGSGETGSWKSPEMTLARTGSRGDNDGNETDIDTAIGTDTGTGTGTGKDTAGKLGLVSGATSHKLRL